MKAPVAPVSELCLNEVMLFTDVRSLDQVFTSLGTMTLILDLPSLSYVLTVEFFKILMMQTYCRH